MSNFSFSHSIFLPFWRTLYHFYPIDNCRLQSLSVWKSLKLVVWESINKGLFGKELTEGANVTMMLT